jgi:hypothetical protein
MRGRYSNAKDLSELLKLVDTAVRVAFFGSRHGSSHATTALILPSECFRLGQRMSYPISHAFRMNIKKTVRVQVSSYSLFHEAGRQLIAAFGTVPRTPVWMRPLLQQIVEK